MIVTMKDYPYSGMYFISSENLVLPEGAQWDASSKLKSVTLQKIFLIF
jgi:hypothetical protein